MSRSHTQLLPIIRSKSPDSESLSVGTVCRHPPRDVSIGSLVSLLSASDCQTSSVDRVRHHRKENAHPTPRSSLGIPGRCSPAFPSSSLGQANLARWKSEDGRRLHSFSSFTGNSPLVPPDTESGFDHPPRPQTVGSVDLPVSEHLGPGLSSYSLALDGKRQTRSATPFKRWMTALRKRSVRLKGTSSPSHSSAHSSSSRMSLWHDPAPGHLSRPSPSFTSSLGLLAAVKSASVTLGSTSAVFSVFSSRHSVHNGGSLDRDDGTTSSAARSRQTPDRDERARRYMLRWRILDELLVSEESYLSGLKALSNVYLTIFASEPLLAQNKRVIQKIFSQLQELHETVMNILDREIRPYHLHVDDPSRSGVKPARQMANIDLSKTAIIAGNIARSLIELAPQFRFAYEAFSSHQEIIAAISGSVSAGIEAWPDYERGVEALSVPLASITNRDAALNKSLTMSDLLIKPIQRICKYALILETLHDSLPACDHSESHGLVAHAFEKFRLILQAVNDVRDNEHARKLIHISWILQKRLTFPPTPTTLYPGTVAGLGKILLCGVLFASFETSGRVDGRYSICCLYQTHLILATGQPNAPSSKRYTIFAILQLGQCTLEDIAHCRGLHGRSPSFSWKLIFALQAQNYEIVLSAVSEKEESVWKEQLQSQIQSEKSGKWQILQGGERTFVQGSRIFIPIQPLNHSRRLLRRLSLYYPPSISWFKGSHRQPSGKFAQTLAPTENGFPTTVRRSISHSSRDSVTVLCPQRAERLALENQVADVWTRHLLPLSAAGTMEIVRNTTASVIQKLSIASLAGSLSKRTASYNGTNANSIGAQNKDSVKEVGCSMLFRLASENERPSSSLGIPVNSNHPLDNCAASLSEKIDDDHTRGVEDGGERREPLPVLHLAPDAQVMRQLKRSRSNPLTIYFSATTTCTKSQIPAEVVEHLRASPPNPPPSSPRMCMGQVPSLEKFAFPADTAPDEKTHDPPNHEPSLTSESGSVSGANTDDRMENTDSCPTVVDVVVGSAIGEPKDSNEKTTVVPLPGPKPRTRTVPAVLDALTPKKFRRRPGKAQAATTKVSSSSSSATRKLTWLLG